MENLRKEARHFQSNLLHNLFKSIPNLQSISFTKSNEYDDNNYFDSLVVDQINDICIEDGGYIKDQDDKIMRDDYEGGTADETKLIDEDLVSYVVDIVEQAVHDDDYDYGDHQLFKEDFENPKERHSSSEAFIYYYQSFISGERVKDESIFKDNPEIAVCYAYDVLKGRLSQEVEKSLKESFFLCYLYAKYVIKNKLPRELENHFNLKSFNSLNQEEKKYFRLYKEFLESSHVTQEV